MSLDEKDKDEKIVEYTVEGLFCIFTNDYNKKFENIKKYIEKKLNEDYEKNIDIFFIHIGDNFYSKNYK